MKFLMFLQLFAHAHQERWSSLVDAKLRQTLVTRDNYIFNTNYEGNPKSGKVKIPVRDTEVTVKDYNKATGVDLETGTTTYMDLNIDQDKAVNELIDGFDAAAVPDNILADRLDSAGYSLALEMDQKSINLLETTSGINVCATKTAATDQTAYKEVLAAKTYLTRKGVPQAGRWLICSPEFMAVLMLDDHFIRQGDLSQELKNAGAVGSVAGFAVFESGNTMYEDTKLVASKKTTTEFIAGHPNWCHRVQEWGVDVHVQDLAGSGKYIGASAVQGRKIYGLKISKPQTVYVKRTEAAA
jgi:N4-gp56 family major capsid protein